MAESRSKAKSFGISKWVVWEAWQQVRANQGAAGVDEESIQDFERNLQGNLYKVWNRLSSGSYMPPPVRMVRIPKRDGQGVRILGVPTVAGRVAQTVVKMYLEPCVEPVFHEDSYGYRPGRSALDAVTACRERCFRSGWVIDLDIESFFDSLDHELVLKAVAHHTGERWILLYVKRWLEAPLDEGGGTLVARDRGTPQGSAISPLLANIFLHYGKRRDKTGMGKGMRTPDTEGVATHSGPESCVGDPRGRSEALAGVRAGWVIEPRNRLVRGADALVVSGRQHRRGRYCESSLDPARSKSLGMYGVSMRENREVPLIARRGGQRNG